MVQEVLRSKTPLNDNTISATSGDITLSPAGGSVSSNGSGGLRISVGTEAQRHSTIIRTYKIPTLIIIPFEGYNGSTWLRLHGLQDLDGDTKIQLNLSGANDDTIRFIVQNTTVGDLTSVRLSVPTPVDDIQIDTNVISTVTTDTDLILDAQGTGPGKICKLWL